MASRKPICLFCDEKPRREKADTMATTKDQWKMFFCSRKCALLWAGYEPSMTNEWCPTHRRWYHPDDGCYLCDRNDE